MTLEPLLLAAADENDTFAQRTLCAAVFGDADLLATEKKFGQLDLALHDFVKRCYPKSRALSDELRCRMRDFSRTLRKISCITCAKSEQFVCRGDAAHDDQIVARGGDCLRPLKQLIEIVDGLCGSAYANTRHPFTPPKIMLSTTSVHADADGDLLGEFNIRGWHQVADGGSPTSLVGLDIREQAFNWAALCATFYTLAHEMVCHGFQSLRRAPDAGRENAPQECPWSEGWMDQLAFELTLHWIDHHKKRLPAWLVHDVLAVKGISNRLHERRYDARGNLKLWPATNRRFGRWSFEALRLAFNSQAPLDRHPVTRFSLALNLHNLTFYQRVDCVRNIAGILQSAGHAPQRVSRLLGLCMDFCEHDNATAFLDELQALVSRR